jgi:hypothetical protein
MFGVHAQQPIQPEPFPRAFVVSCECRSDPGQRIDHHWNDYAQQYLHKLTRRERDVLSFGTSIVSPSTETVPHRQPILPELSN